MKFVDFFSGVGGIRLGLERSGHECVGFCEWDKFARQAYKAMYDTEGEWENHDIRTAESYGVPKADLWTFGFPCQDLSIAGKRKGLQEGERSGLFYEIIRLLSGLRKEDRPKWVLLENVKGLFSAGRGFDFLRCIVELGQLGYSIEYQLLNSKDFGVPQNRERVFIVGYLGDGSRREVFPLRRTDGENPCTSEEQRPIRLGNIYGRDKGTSFAGNVWDKHSISPTLTTMGGGNREPMILDNIKTIGSYNPSGHSSGRVVDPQGIAPTVMDNHGLASAVAIDMTENNPKTSSTVRCLKARYTADVTNFSGDNSGILVKEATKQGYTEAYDGDSVNLAQPNSQTRRGRVGKQIANTLTCGDTMGVVIGGKSNGNANKGNTFEILRVLREEIGEKAFTKWGLAIIASFQQTEVLQQRVHEKSILENRGTSEDIQQCSYYGKVDEQADNQTRELSNLWWHKEFRCSPQGREFQQQYSREFDCIVQKLPYETAPTSNFLQSLWQSSEGIGVLREALSKIQKVWQSVDVLRKSSVRIRKLTPREVWRLQGFPDECFDKAVAAGVSNSQLYKQAGNAVTVNVAEAIGKRLKEIELMEGQT